MRSKIQQQLQAMEETGGAAFAGELIDLFFVECEGRFSKIEAVLPDGLTEAGQLFHKIQGSAGWTGATRLRRICLLGEKACKQGDSQLADRSLRVGSRELDLLKPLFEELTKK